jgi:uncharacterized MAPEG superfamily protein
MPIEIRILAGAVVLGILQLFAAIHLITKQRGVQWNIGPRDEKMPDITGLAGRLDRAFKNFLETFGFFAAAVLMVTEMKAGNSISGLGAEIYLLARIAYVPAYALAATGLRTAIWMASMIGLFMVLSALI